MRLDPTQSFDNSIHIGVDVGLRRLSIASWQLEFAHSIVLPAPTSTRPTSRQMELHQLTHWLWETTGRHRINPHDITLWIERPYMGNGVGNVSTTIGLSETVGAVMVAGQWHDAHKIDASTWKANVLGPGHGHAGKEEIQEWLTAEHPELAQHCKTEDEFDAMCASLYGQMRHSGVVEAPVKAPRKRAHSGRRGQRT